MSQPHGYDLKKILVSTTGLVVLLIVLILLNVILSFANVRWDATEDKIYSLSKGTKNILSELGEPVRIKFFYTRSSPNLPTNLKLYANRVQEFLSEYERYSKGQVRVDMVDPKPDSDEEEWAQKYGLQPLQVSGGDRVFCGLVFLSADREETYDLMDPSREDRLEYDITRTIHHLQSYTKRALGIITSLPVFGRPAVNPMGQPSREEPWVVVEELRKTYDVRQIDMTASEIDPDVDLLVIIHPKELTPRLEYAIDQYVLRGGNALIFVDPLCVSDMDPGQQRFMRPPGSTLPRLFQAWGVSMDTAKCVADLEQPTRIRSGSGVEANPVWISARGGSFSKSSVVTSGLESMLLPISGAIKKLESSSYDYEPLVRSAKNSALVDTFKAGFGADAVRRDFPATGDHFDLAVKVRGTFKTAFPAGPPKDEKATSEGKDNTADRGTPDQLKEGKAPATLIIVGDADMLADRFFVQRGRFLGFNLSKVFNDNLNFLANACEILMGSDDLISVRSRGKFERPFTAVLDLQTRAQEKWLSKEKELTREVEETNRKLRELENQKDASQRLIMSPEQEAEVEKFKEERRRIRKELKGVRKNLRADIEVLGTRLKAVNIFLMPLLVSLAGIGFAIYKQRRMRKR